MENVFCCCENVYRDNENPEFYIYNKWMIPFIHFPMMKCYCKDNRS